MKALRSILTLTALGPSTGCGDATNAGDDARAGAVLSDALSMPAEPTVALERFTAAEVCGHCHPTHYAEWRTSHHAHAMHDPVFRAFVAVRQRDHDGAQDKFCLQCHSAIGTRGGDIVPGFDFADLEPITLEGVTCESCHRVAALVRPFNSGHVLDPDGPIRGTIAAPAVSPFHDSQHSPLHATSAFCAGCHDIREVDGLALERPFAEWTGSPAAASGVECQHCHMPTHEGPAAVGGPTRTLHRHTWIGVDVPLADDLSPAQQAELRAQSRALLAGAATVTLEAPPAIAAGDLLDLRVTVRNNIPAHNFPTGSTFNRQAWLELLVRDGDGDLVFATGTRDARGDLEPRDAPELLSLGSVLLDPRGEPTLFPWRAAAHVSHSLPPLQARELALRVPTSAAAPGPLAIEARILFRAFAPHALRALGLDAYTDDLEIHEVSRAAIGVELLPP